MWVWFTRLIPAGKNPFFVLLLKQYRSPNKGIKMNTKSIHLPLLSFFLCCAVSSVQAQVPPPENASEVLSSAYTGEAYSPYAGRNFASQAFWGDTHLHTNLSMDAGAFGNRLGLDDAYRFARGEEVNSTSAGPVKLSRPLDFLVIADHSDGMGFFPDMLAGASHILADPTGKDWYNRVMAGEGAGVAIELIGLFSQGNFPKALSYTCTAPSEAGDDVLKEVLIAPRL
jgi:hypothetical protein